MKKWICGALAALLLLLAGCGDTDQDRYENAIALYEAGNYAEASREFARLGDYEDSASMVAACEYALAAALYEAGEFSEAEAAFAALGDYGSSAAMVTACRYNLAVQLMNEGYYPDAAAAFEALGEYEDAPQLRQQALELHEQARWRDLLAFLIAQPPYMTGEGCYVGITAADPDELTFWAEKTMDLGFYVVVDRCAVSFTLGAAEGRYELQTQTQTQADGLTGRTTCSAGGSIKLAELRADTQLALTDFHYHGQDVYGNVTERTEPGITELVTARELLPVLLENIPALLEQSGTGYTLQELGFTGLE